MPRGGLGVRYSRICCWRCCVRRGGVTSTELEERAGVGGVLDRAGEVGRVMDIWVSSSVKFVSQSVRRKPKEALIHTDLPSLVL